MNDIDSRGYKVQGTDHKWRHKSSDPGMTYNRFDKQGTGGNSVDAESKGYKDILKRFIEAETANGYIEIVK